MFIKQNESKLIYHGYRYKREVYRKDFNTDKIYGLPIVFEKDCDGETL